MQINCKNSKEISDVAAHDGNTICFKDFTSLVDDDI